MADDENGLLVLTLKTRAGAFLRHEAAGGVVLLVAAIVALLLSNSPLAWMDV